MRTTLNIDFLQCEMILSSKYALNRHVKEVHQKQQEHVCPKCRKSFTQHSNLKQHMLIHLGVKPFLCQHGQCKSAFTTKQCLQVHYRKVHRYRDEDMPAIKRLEIYNKIFDFKAMGGGGVKVGGAGAAYNKVAAASAAASSASAAAQLQHQQQHHNKRSAQQRQQQQQPQDEDSAHSSNNSIDTSSEYIPYSRTYRFIFFASFLHFS